MNTLLNRVGETLYGDRWQTAISELLDVSDRTVRRWVSGESPVPQGVWKEFFIKLDLRRDEVDHLISLVKEKMDTTP